MKIIEENSISVFNVLHFDSVSIKKIQINTHALSKLNLGKLLKSANYLITVKRSKDTYDFNQAKVDI